MGEQKSSSNVGLFIVAALVIAAVNFWPNFSSNRTASVQQVFRDGQDYKLYVNDGTVWLVDHEFSVIVGDEIRYQHVVPPPLTSDAMFKRSLALAENREPPKEPDSPDLVCRLINVTRGAETMAARITGPKQATSCPAK
jgi:hypothetical protein